MKRWISGVFALLGAASASIVVTTPRAQAQAAVVCVNCSDLTTQALQYAKEAASLAEQIEMYTLQIKQYQNMLQNTQALGGFDWNNAVGDILGIRNAMNSAMMLGNNAGSFTASLGNVQAFATQLESLTQMQTQYQQWGTVTQNDINRLQTSLGLQETQRQSDAQALTNLQGQVSGSIGQMQAIQAGDSIGALGVSQLQKIQELLAQETQLVVDQTTVNKDQQAMRQTGREQFLNSVLPALQGNGHGYQ